MPLRDKTATTPVRIIQAIGSVAGWFAVIVQFYLIIENRTTSVPETIIRYFSFYTILTNILVALCFTISFFKPSSYWGRFFTLPATLTAIVVYISVVGLTYNLILRALWKPTGMQRIVDELLHLVIPLLFILYWFLTEQTSRVKWKNAFIWLIYPLCYLLFILLRGRFSDYYPYPFINVTDLGYSKVLLNCFFLFLTFLFVAFAFILIGRMSRNSKP